MKPTIDLTPSEAPRDPAGLRPEAGWEREPKRGSGWRRWRWPVPLFLMTLLSTFWVGAAGWQPLRAVQDPSLTAGLELRRYLLEHWQQGLIYMVWVVGILLLHELGHYVTTLIYRVPASPPIFLPFPLNPIGTLGAVISMEGQAGNRREIFDIGLAGPLAGLTLAVPAAWIGVSQLDLTPVASGELGLRLPLLIQWMITWMEIPGYHGQAIWLSQLNPWLAAAWVGFLITGLNMIPVGQMDGGHVTFGLFGPRIAYWIASAMIVMAVAFMVYWQSYTLTAMVILLLVVGTEHPPTGDDTVPMGPIRWILGLASLAIPVLCFPPLVFDFRV